MQNVKYKRLLKFTVFISVVVVVLISIRSISPELAYFLSLPALVFILVFIFISALVRRFLFKRNLDDLNGRGH